MLQFTDFDEKQIIFIESYDSKDISFQNENLVIKEDGDIKNKVSLFKIFAIFLIGETTLSSVIIRKFQDFGVTLVLLKKNFLPYLVIGNETEGHILLRKKQYSISEDQMLHIAKNIVLLKTQNELLLLKNIRNKSDTLKKDIEKIKDIIDKIPNAIDYKSLLGYEGNVAKLFFTNYFAPIVWHRRLPRAKTDVPNLLLDIGYTYLFHFIEALLRLYGFDNYYGVYHRGWYQRKSLALDLMEPFRCIINRAVLKAHNLGQIDHRDFKYGNGQYSLDWKNSKKYTNIFLRAIMDEKQEMFYFIKEYYKYFIKGRQEFPDYKIIK